jgi:hypothetical protein
MRKILWLAVTIAFSGGPASALAAPARLELRPGDLNPGAGLSATAFPGFSQPVFLSETPAITNADIAYAQATTHSGVPAVAVTLDKPAADRFCGVTGTRVGKPMGVFVDGKLVNVALIPNPICDGNVILTGRFSADEAKRIAAAFPEGPADALKAHSVWKGIGEQSKPELAYPMILFVRQRWGGEFEGTTWYPTLENGLIKVTGRIDASGAVTFSEDEVLFGEASEQRLGVLPGAKYTARLEQGTLRGHGRWLDPKTKEVVTLNFSLKLAE